MAALQDEPHSPRDFLPGDDAGLKLGAALVGEGVIPANSGAVFRGLLARDANLPLALKRIKQGVKRSLAEGENAIATPAQLSGEFIAIHVPLGKKLHDQRSGAAFEELGLGFHSMYYIV